MKKSSTIDTTYEYTKNLLECQESSLNRLDAKISTFVGFSGILIRLALDLPSSSFIEHTIRIGVCAFSLTAIFTSAIGLLAKNTGKTADPEELMSDKWFFEKGEEEIQAYIVNGWIETLDEYEEITKKKANRLKWIVICFSIASILFGVGVSLS